MTSPIITENNVIGMFYERLQQNAASSVVDAISTPAIESDQDSEKYAWLGMVPQMSEKRGTKKFSQLRDTDWTVTNVEYQGGIALPKKHILYDKTDQVQIRVNELADRTNIHWWAKMVAPLIIAGESTACYDGQYFFDTDHEEGDSGQQSNDLLVSADDADEPTTAEMIDAILEAVEKMNAFKDDRGEFVNEGNTDFLILTGMGFLKSGLKALSQTRTSTNETNILLEQDSFNLRIHASPRLNSWTTKFAVFSTQGTQKPIIRQQRRPNQAGQGVNVDGLLLETLWLDSEHCKKHDECLISVETERAAAYGDWKKACLVTFTEGG